jgi:hypothetical protein
MVLELIVDLLSCGSPCSITLIINQGTHHEEMQLALSTHTRTYHLVVSRQEFFSFRRYLQENPLYSRCRVFTRHFEGGMGCHEVYVPGLSQNLSETFEFQLDLFDWSR